MCISIIDDEERGSNEDDDAHYILDAKNLH